jgi:hypothetical protein
MIYRRQHQYMEVLCELKILKSVVEMQQFTNFVIYRVEFIVCSHCTASKEMGKQKMYQWVIY